MNDVKNSYIHTQREKERNMQTRTQGLESADPKSNLACSTLTRQHRKVT